MDATRRAGHRNPRNPRSAHIEMSQANKSHSDNNLNRTPDVFGRRSNRRPGRQYAAAEFGLSENEQFQHPRMFRDMDYSTNQQAFENLRNAEPRRPTFRPMHSSRHSSMPNECLSDISAPSLCDLSIPQRSRTRSQYDPFISQRSRSSFPAECLDNQTAPSMYSSGATSPYRQQRSRSLPNECLDNVSAPGMYESVASSRNEFLNDISAPTMCDVSAPSLYDFQSSPPNQNEGLDDPSTLQYQTANGALPARAPVTSESASGMPFNSVYLNQTYADVLNRFKKLRDGIFPAGSSASQRSAEASGKSELCDTEMETDDVFGEDQVCSPECIKVTTTQVNGSGFDCIKETIIERSAIENGEIQQTLKRILTKRDQSGNVTSQSNESKSTYGGKDTTTMLDDIQAPSFDSGVGSASRASPVPQDNISKLRTHVRKKLNFILPEFEHENLDDVSAPAMQECFSMTPEQLDDISQPSCPNIYASPLRRPSLPSESFAECSPISGTAQRRSISLPSQQLCNESALSFSSTNASGPSEYSHQASLPGYSEYLPPRRRPATSFPSECLDNEGAPSFGRSLSRHSTSRRSRSLPSQNIAEITAPHFASSAASAYTSECLDQMSMPAVDHQISMPSEYLADMSFPSFGGDAIGMLSYPTGEQLEDLTMPSFDQCNYSVLEPPQRHVSLPSECLDEMNAPSFGRSLSIQTSGRRSRSLPGQQISNISQPSFASSGASSRRQFSFPSENVCDVSQPSFAFSGTPSRRSNMPSEQLDQMSMPSFDQGDYSVLEAPQRQVSLPSECLGDVSAPSFGRSMSCASLPYPSQQINLPNECLDDMTAPSFGTSMSMQSSGRRSRSLPRQQIFDISQPSFASSGASSRRQISFPSQNLCDVSQPSFASTGVSSRRQPSFPSQNLSDVSQPSFASTGVSSRRQPSFPSQNLSDVSQPSFASSGAPSRRQISFPSQNICDVSQPSFASSGASSRRQISFPSQNLCDVSQPSFASSGASSRRQISFPSQNLCDVSQPSFASTGVSSRRQPSLPSQNLCDISQPSFASSGASSRRQISFPSQNICDVSQPSFASSGASSRLRQPSFPSQNLCDVSQPSFASSGVSSRRQISFPSQNLFDESQPSFASSGASSRRTVPMPCEIVQPSFESTGRRPTPYSNISSLSAPSYYYNQASSRRYSHPSELLSEVTMPSFNESMLMSPPRRKVTMDREDSSAVGARFADTGMIPRGMPSNLLSDRIDDISAPAFNISVSIPVERIEDISRPMFEDTHTDINISASQQKMHTLPQERLDDVSAPYLDKTNESIVVGASVTSFTRVYPDMPSDRLDDISGPQFESTKDDSIGPRRSYTRPSENLGDISEPSMAQSEPSSVPAPSLRKLHSTGPTPSRRQSPRCRTVTPGRRGPDVATSYAPTNQSTRQSYRGFDTMANYAPFEEQIRSRGRSEACDPCAGLINEEEDFEDPCPRDIQSLYSPDSFRSGNANDRNRTC